MVPRPLVLNTMKTANRLLTLAVLALLALLLTTAIRTEQAQRTAERHAYVYYFPVVALSGQRGPVPPVRSTSQKRGVGLTHGECADEFGSWSYDWSANPPACAAETVPMAWCGVPGSVGGTSQWLMGMNEPDRPDQCNTDPATAAGWWKEIEERYPDRKLLAPAPSQLRPEWLVEFRDAFVAANGRPPRLDALALHCYLWTAAECETLVEQYEAWAREWDVPGVWVTEFAFSTGGGMRSEDAAWQETSKFIQWMDLDPMVTRYAFFAARIWGDEPWAPPAGWFDSLMNRDGSISSWGRRLLATK